MKQKWITGLLAGVLAFSVAHSADEEGERFLDPLVTRLEKVLPENLTVKSATKSTVDEVYQIGLSDGSFIYLLGKSGHFVVGDLYSLQSGSLVNLTEQEARAPQRQALIDSIDEDDMIIFNAKKHVKARLTVFTDIDCGYCQKFHRDVPALNKRGIEVRYLAYPRSGVDSSGAIKLATAWCSKDRQEALTKLKRGEALPPKRCNDPVAKQYQTGVAIGINGTPTMVHEDGSLLPGYLPIGELIEWLDI